MHRGLVAGVVMTMALPLGAGDRPTGRLFATRSIVYARHGMVAAAHPLAVQIGVDVLKRGGSAVDAAIAVNAALGFLEPMSCGIGGDLFAIVWDAKSGKLYGLNASGRAPGALTADKVPPEADGTIPYRTPYAWTVPGAVDGWFELHHRFGRLSMPEVLAPAIQAARDGEPVPQVIAGAWGIAAGAAQGHAGFRRGLPPGRPCAPRGRDLQQRVPGSRLRGARRRGPGRVLLGAYRTGLWWPSRRRTAVSSRPRTSPSITRNGSSRCPPTIAAYVSSSCLPTARASPPSRC